MLFNTYLQQQLRLLNPSWGAQLLPFWQLKFYCASVEPSAPTCSDLIGMLRRSSAPCCSSEYHSWKKLMAIVNHYYRLYKRYQRCQNYICSSSVLPYLPQHPTLQTDKLLQLQRCRRVSSLSRSSSPRTTRLVYHKPSPVTYISAGRRFQMWQSLC